MPQLRQNIITGEWVVIAPERAKRPSDFVGRKTSIRPDAGEESVFRVGGDAWKTRHKEFDTKNIFVIPNKYPAFLEGPQNLSTRAHQVEDRFYLIRPSIGGHDVVVIKDENTVGPTKFNQTVWQDLFLTFKRRYQYFDSVNSNYYSMPIYNYKPEAAASIWHPHAQIFCSPVVPNNVRRELEQTRRYFELNGVNVFSDLVAHEQKQKIRVIAETRDYLAFTLYAARFPFETWIVPKFHMAHFMSMSDKLIAQLAKICRIVFGKLDNALDDPPLNFFIHSAPNSEKNAPYYRWHMEIGPRLSNYGGFELGAGMVIDVVSPENAARYLRNELVD